MGDEGRELNLDVTAEVTKQRLARCLNDMRDIRDAGVAAKSRPDSIPMFKGMIRSSDFIFNQYTDMYYDLSAQYLSAGRAAEFPTATDQAQFDTIKRYYYEGCAHHETILSLAREASANPGPSSRPDNITLNTTQSIRARLPKIDIPTFKGDLQDWPLFKDTYTRLIHEEPSVAVIEKFYFLVGALKGPALQLIKGISVTEQTYDQAWEAVTKEYDSKRRLGSFYLNQLLNFKQLQGKPTKTSLNKFLLEVSENVNAFNNLKIPNASEYILFEIAIKCLDAETRHDFEVENSSVTFPTITSLTKFVRERYQALQIIDESKNPSSSSPNPPSHPYQTRSKSRKYPTPNSSSLFVNEGSKSNQTSDRSKRTTPATNTSKSTSPHPPTAPSNSNKQQNPPNCVICQQSHKITDCPTYKTMSVSDRVKQIQKWGACQNCLFPGHKSRDCKSQWTCRICSLRHHTTLHFPRAEDNKTDNQNAAFSAPVSGDNPPGSTCNSTSQINSDVLLGTAVARIRDASHNYHYIRLIIDSGSQFSFITEECAAKLNLPCSPFSRSILGISQSPLSSTKGKVSCNIRPVQSDQPELNAEAVVVPTITPYLPSSVVPESVCRSFANFDLADPDFWYPGKIDFLLGANLFMDILRGSPTVVNSNEPRLLNTVFGQVVIGEFKINQPSTSNLASSFFVTCENSDINQIMHRFWEIEEVAAKIKPSEEDEFCETHFQETHQRLPCGRYVVRLPFKKNDINFGSTKPKALSRLYNLESKMQKDSNLKEEYHSFMQEYINLGHMQATSNPASYIIPHHSIRKIDGEVTKFRVVFDGSSRTSRGSLNDHLLTGPKLQADICIIILNFRCHKYVFITDIVKMFRQVHIHEDDRKYQHILWRFSPDQEVQEYELITITYGLAPSPFLAIRTLHQLVADEGHHFPLAAPVLQKNAYVDDISAGASNAQRLVQIKDQLIGLLSKGGFSLSKWATNCRELIESLNSNEEQCPISLNEDSGTQIKILGLQWDPYHDVFSFSVLMPQLHFTKRSILSMIASIFDPMGYLAPSVFYAKRIMQETWKLKIGWDDIVPEQLQKAWSEFVNDLPNLRLLRIPRYLHLDVEARLCNLYGFCDASQDGYCAALYVGVFINNKPELYLIKSKTKLAPLKQITVPRLELCGALLLAQLLSSIEPFISDIHPDQIFLFTDSLIVLSWLKTPLYKLKIFVANRVSQILEVTNVDSWRHISTSFNPADCGSRGLLPSQLVNHRLWWCGPDWISQPELEWPTSSRILPENDLPETKPQTIALTTSSVLPHELKWMEGISDYIKLINSLAYALRCLSNAKRSTVSKVYGPITEEEFSKSRFKCIQLLQHFYYPEAFDSSLKQSSLLSSLNVFIDQQGLLRVGGRLTRSELTFSQRHPLLLPRRSHFNNLLIDYYHEQHFHTGCSSLQAAIQLEYWIPSVRSLIRQRKSQCIVCRRLSKPEHQPYMADLPKCRVSRAEPFYHSGVDFAGPFQCRDSLRRKPVITKAYLCLFVCLTTKAVHLKTVGSLSTEAFIDALDRFISRRGKPATITSDCGTNFVGASNYLKEVKEWLDSQTTQTSIIDHTSHQGIKWIFNPPNAPHFGGLWEAAVKSTKKLLYRQLGNQILTEPELNTIFIKIEAILNSRPITPLSSDPQDLEPLTPGHFLVGRPLTALPEVDLVDEPENRLTRWQLQRERVQTFWLRWKDEYLQTLQQRGKWIKSAPNLSEGDLVLIKDSNTPPLKWPLGRIVTTHPGSDGTVRVVTVRTQSGTYKRPVVKIVPLFPESSTKLQQPHRLSESVTVREIVSGDNISDQSAAEPDKI